MLTISSIELANFIAQKCIVSCLGEQVLINCYSRQDYIFLICQRKNIQQALTFITSENFFQIKWATIGIVNTELRQSFPMQQNNQRIEPIPPSTDLIGECLTYEGACGIVRMSDHKGLFSNELITYSSNAHPNDWVGKNMADFWIKDELDVYIARLLKEGELKNYSYVAKMMDGQNAKLTVDARIIQWRGETARIVKTVSRELLT